MSTRIMAECWPLQMPPTAKSVLISLADNANDDGYCYPSISYICERTCYKKDAVIEAVRWLEQSGILTADRASGRNTTYTITPKCFTEIPHVSRRETSRANQLVGQTNRSGKTANRSGKPTKPVGQTDTNHKEPSIEPSLKNNTALAIVSGGKVKTVEHSPQIGMLMQLPGMTDQVAKDFLTVRRAKKSPLTATALALIAKESAKAGITTAQAIAIATARGWVSFKADWIMSDDSQKTHAERTQDFKNQQAEKFYAPLLTMTDEEKREWGFA